MAASESKDGPVMSLINKKLRALEKKLKRILQTEDSVAQGKPLNKDQEELLRSKPSVLTLIEEYEKLRQPLSISLQEELNLALQHQQVTPPQVSDKEKEPEKDRIEDTPVDSKLEESVLDLLKLLYFGSMFDVKPQSEFDNIFYTRTHERESCLTYDYINDDATDFLGEKDLDMIADLRGRVVSRPVHSRLSHKNALQSCVQHAKLWLANSEQPIEDGSNITYAALRERLDKILASDYFTTIPEMKAPVEVAAAAAAGKYVPVQGSSVSSEVTVHTESDSAHYEQKDEEAEHSEGQEAGVDQSGSEHLKESEMPNAPDDSSTEQEQKPEADTEEQTPRDAESKDQQYIPRRGYPNNRGGSRGGGGGRRGGYPSGRGGRGGRGGGGPQNGRGGQYYDQSNYYPRNYYNTPRGRGGASRGGGAGGNAYNNNHGSAPSRGGGAQGEELRS